LANPFNILKADTDGSLETEGAKPVARPTNVMTLL
jgi:hypothetical protein